MCSPTGLAASSLAIGTASSAASFIGQSQASQARAEAANQRARRVNREANAAFLRQSAAENRRLSQQADATSQQLQRTESEARRAQARANVQAAEQGVSGNSVEALLADFDRQQAQRAEAIRQNFQFQVEQSEQNKRGFRAQAERRIASSRPGPTQMPSPIAAGLQIGSSAIQAASIENSLKPPGSPVTFLGFGGGSSGGGQ